MISSDWSGDGFHLTDVRTLDVDTLHPVRINIVTISKLEHCLGLVNDPADEVIDEWLVAGDDVSPESTRESPLSNISSVQPALIINSVEGPGLVSEVSLEHVDALHTGNSIIVSGNSFITTGNSL